jgi:hypothetical protein
MTGSLTAVTHLLAASLASSAPTNRAILEDSRYLPGTLYHYAQAQEMLEAGQVGMAAAHSRLVLHDQGLKVFVDFSRTPEGLRSTGQRTVEKAVDYWNQTLGSQALQLVETPSDAQVTVMFASDVVLQGVRVGGYCSQSRGVTIGASGEPAAQYSATILARFQLPGGRRLSDDCLLNVVTHEFGHVFGLNDCTEPGHLMSPLNLSRPRTDLHPDELEALGALRLTTLAMQRSMLYRAFGR